MFILNTKRTALKQPANSLKGSELFSKNIPLLFSSLFEKVRFTNFRKLAGFKINVCVITVCNILYKRKKVKQPENDNFHAFKLGF